MALGIILLSTAVFAAPNPFFTLCMDTHDAKKRSLEQQAALISELGYDGVGHLWLDNVPERLKTLDAAGLKLFQIYIRVNVASDAKDAYDARLKDILPLLKGRNTMLAALVGGGKPSDDSRDVRAVELLRQIADMAKPFGVRVALYPHSGDWLERTEDAVRIAKKVDRPNVGAMFNVCHWLKVDDEKNLDSILQTAKPYLFAVTINGADHAVDIHSGKGKWIQPLDSGEFEIGALLQKLNTIGYTGPIGLQCFGLTGDAREHLTRSMEAWKRLNHLPEPAGINPCTPWPATDALGRSTPLPEEVGPPKRGRFVGIFYFLWHTPRADRNPEDNGPYDNTKILARHPDAMKNGDSPPWGPRGMFHYWGEPLFGYYVGTDPWVLRRHAQLLADAGIDVLIFDATNTLTYPEIYRALCEVFRQVRAEGGRTPQLAFMVNTEAGRTAQKLFGEFYANELFPELWFKWHGKPLLICDPEQASPELKQFFTLRRAHWPFAMTNTPYAWHWEATYPQPYGYTDDPKIPEQVNVSVAQNLRADDGKVTNMSWGNARGRSFHDGAMDRTSGAVNRGFNFQEQWKRVFELTPPFVMVTGWNEWIAGNWGEKGGPPVFVDQLDQEFSRDIEPMKGGHGDNYYWQLVSNVRRFKGAPPLPTASPPKTIRLQNGFAQWQDVAPEFTDHVGETAPRDWDGIGGLHYVNGSGRNDLAAFKVARDERSIYFYARSREAFSPSSGTNWMWLLIDADMNPATGWEGYDFIVNRTIGPKGTTWIEKNVGGWNWKKVTKVKFAVTGNEMQLAVPRSVLNLSKQKRICFDFKWADNLQRPGDIMDFYLSGDVAPEGRFRYRFIGE